MPGQSAVQNINAQQVTDDVHTGHCHHAGQGPAAVAVQLHDGREQFGSGKVWEHSYAELKALDFGTKPGYEGLQVATFEEILKKLSCHAVMNIHLKTPEDT